MKLADMKSDWEGVFQAGCVACAANGGGATTTSADMADIAGASAYLCLPGAGKVTVLMAIDAALDAPGASTGGWSVSVGGVESGEKQKALSATDERLVLLIACVDVAPETAAAGPVTVQARHRRVSGSEGIVTGSVQMAAWAAIS